MGLLVYDSEGTNKTKYFKRVDDSILPETRQECLSHSCRTKKMSEGEWGVCSMWEAQRFSNKYPCLCQSHHLELANSGRVLRSFDPSIARFGGFIVVGGGGGWGGCKCAGLLVPTCLYSQLRTSMVDPGFWPWQCHLGCTHKLNPFQEVHGLQCCHIVFFGSQN